MSDQFPDSSRKSGPSFDEHIIVGKIRIAKPGWSIPNHYIAKFLLDCAHYVRKTGKRHISSYECCLLDYQAKLFEKLEFKTGDPILARLAGLRVEPYLDNKGRPRALLRAIVEKFADLRPAMREKPEDGSAQAEVVVPWAVPPKDGSEGGPAPSSLNYSIGKSNGSRKANARIPWAGKDVIEKLRFGPPRPLSSAALKNPPYSSWFPPEGKIRPALKARPLVEVKSGPQIPRGPQAKPAPPAGGRYRINDMARIEYVPPSVPKAEPSQKAAPKAESSPKDGPSPMAKQGPLGSGVFVMRPGANSLPAPEQAPKSASQDPGFLILSTLDPALLDAIYLAPPMVAYEKPAPAPEKKEAEKPVETVLPRPKM